LTEEKTFARKASGLVKEASPLKAMFFNLSCIMGSKFFWSLTYFGLFAAGLVYGMPPLLWFVLLIGIVSFILGIIYVQIVTPMPRSGADYVVPARVMGPFWGWINSWMILWSWLPVWGWMAWATVRNLKLINDVLNIAGVTVGSTAWILAEPATWIFGFLTIAIAIVFCLLPPKRFYTLITGLALFAVFGLVIVIIGSVAGAPYFAENLQRLTGMSESQIIENAARNGFNINETLTFSSTAGLIGYVLFIIGGYQYSASISGELRGNVKRALTISILGSLIAYLIYQVPFVWGLVNLFGYDVISSWSYLFWVTGSPPFGLPPINALLVQIALPNLWPLWLIAAIAGTVGTWLCIPGSMVYLNRQIFAWGMDRMLPTSWTSVWRGVPVKIFLLEGAAAIVFFVLTLFGVNPIDYAWWSVLLMLPSFFFPAICGIIIARRRKDLFAAVPWKRALMPLSILLICSMIPLYVLGFYGTLPGETATQSLWSFAIASGLLLTIIVVIVGIILHYAIRAWNARRGIELDKIFKEIPPE
jgi:amino acid transporter